VISSRRRGRTTKWIASQKKLEAGTCPASAAGIQHLSVLYDRYCTGWVIDSGCIPACFPVDRMWCCPSTGPLSSSMDVSGTGIPDVPSRTCLRAGRNSGSENSKAISSGIDAWSECFAHWGGEYSLSGSASLANQRVFHAVWIESCGQ
jgi:hypothetical protein